MQTGDIYSADLLALTTCCGKRSGNWETSDYWNQVQGQCDGNSQDECKLSTINQSINDLTPKITQLTLQSSVVTMRTAWFNIKDTPFRVLSVFGVLYDYHDTAIMFLHSSQRPFFTIDTRCLVCKAGCQFLNTIHINYSLQRTNK